MNLFIITGTTKGLGKSFYTILSHNPDNIIITINRSDIKNDKGNFNLCIDLAKITDKDIKNFKDLLKNKLTVNIKKIVFINNAFTMGELSKIDNLNSEDIIKSININLISSILLIKEYINVTKEIALDKIVINITSGASKKPIDGWSIYCLSKSAIEMFIKSIGLEYSEYRCFNVEPGVMDTQMQSQIREFKDSKSYDYFDNLFKNKQLKNTDDTAINIIKEYLL